MHIRAKFTSIIGLVTVCGLLMAGCAALKSGASDEPTTTTYRMARPAEPTGMDTGILVGKIELQIDGYQDRNETVTSGLTIHVLTLTGDQARGIVKTHIISPNGNGYFHMPNLPLDTAFVMGKVFVNKSTSFGEDKFDGMAIVFAKGKRAAGATWNFSVDAEGRIKATIVAGGDPNDWFVEKFPKSPWTKFIEEGHSISLKGY